MAGKFTLLRYTPGSKAVRESVIRQSSLVECLLGISQADGRPVFRGSKTRAEKKRGEGVGGGGGEAVGEAVKTSPGCRIPRSVQTDHAYSK